MLKTFKYRIYPNIEQIQTLSKWLDSGRFLWNKMLELNIAQYNTDKTFLFYSHMSKLLKETKQKYSWLEALPYCVLQQKCIDLDQALKNKFKYNKGFPKFKNKTNNTGIRITQLFNGKNSIPQIKILPDQIKLPKLTPIKTIFDRPLEGKLKSITIKRDNTHWYAICLCEIEHLKSIGHLYDAVGLDFGLIDFITTSDGEIFETKRFYKNKQKKLAKLQSQYARKQKGGKNKEKARIKVAKLHQTIRFQRNYYLHSISNAITKQYKTVLIEDLNIKGMSKRYGKSVHDQGWRLLTNQLEYKANWRGGQVIKINQYYPSSQICSNCGNRQKLSLNQRTYNCSCGLSISRDLNAAINIKNTGVPTGIYAYGDTSNGDSLSSSYCVNEIGINQKLKEIVY